MTSAANLPGKIDGRHRNRGVWLVKVPKYLSQRWQQEAGQGEVGRLRVSKGGKGKTEVTFHLNNQSSSANSTASASGGAAADSSKSIPEEHQFITATVQQQTLAVLSEDKTDVEEPDSKSGKLCVEGRVVQKAECRPPPNERYMKMKIDEIHKVNQPEKVIKQIDKAVFKYKPISQHAEAMQSVKAKKESKNVRLDKDKLMELIFHAFEKHQFYKLVDLARITQQPPTYVKDILLEIGQYNTGPTNRYTWELKPEYRHYQADKG